MEEKGPLERRVVLLLVGLIASGKSSFAQALEQHVAHFRRCSQDDLGDRRKVEALARQCLTEGFSVCIDRTNFDARQRATWIEIAHEFPGTQIWVIVFDTPYEVCAQRLRERKDHPTIKTAEQGLSVLARFQSQYRPPSPHEGFSRLLNLRPSDHPSPEYTQRDVLDILQRVQNAPPPDPAPPNPFFAAQASRGYHSRGARGSRGRGYSGSRGASGPKYGRGSQTPYSRANGYGGPVQGGSSTQSTDVESDRRYFGADSRSWRRG